jgi:hypothetical protein
MLILLENQFKGVAYDLERRLMFASNINISGLTQAETLLAEFKMASL